MTHNTRHDTTRHATRQASDTPGNSVNQVHQSTITVGIEGWEPFYRSYQATNVSFATNAQFARLRGFFPFILNDEQPTTQLISFQPYSEVYWWITAESLETLLFSLQSDHVHAFYFILFYFIMIYVIFICISFIPFYDFFEVIIESKCLTVGRC
jgi:hypothetical protein